MTFLTRSLLSSQQHHDASWLGLLYLPYQLWSLASTQLHDTCGYSFLTAHIPCMTSKNTYMQLLQFLFPNHSFCVYSNSCLICSFYNFFPTMHDTMIPWPWFLCLFLTVRILVFLNFYYRAFNSKVVSGKDKQKQRVGDPEILLNIMPFHVKINHCIVNL